MFVSCFCKSKKFRVNVKLKSSWNITDDVAKPHNIIAVFFQNFASPFKKIMPLLIAKSILNKTALHKILAG